MRTGRLYLRGQTWWWDVGVRGRRLRLSTGVTGPPDRKGNPPMAAQLWCAEKLVELGKGNVAALTGTRTTWDELGRMLVERAEAQSRVAVDKVRHAVVKLTRHFGGWYAQDITAPAALRYALDQKAAGYAIATINSELGFLHQALKLGQSYGLVGTVPAIQRLPGQRVRRGLIEDGHLAAILAALPEHLRPIVSFLRWTGWRRAEALGLEWRCVDWAGQEIRLETSKTGEPRAVPFGTYAPLRKILEAQRDAQAGSLGLHVFPGVTPGALTMAWTRAVKAAGVPPNQVVDGRPVGPILHDLRRTFISWADANGLPWAVQKAITGHASDRVHAQYRSVPRREIEDALSRLTGDGAHMYIPGTKTAQFRRRRTDKK
jgi:integrase